MILAELESDGIIIGTLRLGRAFEIIPVLVPIETTGPDFFNIMDPDPGGINYQVYFFYLDRIDKEITMKYKTAIYIYKPIKLSEIDKWRIIKKNIWKKYWDHDESEIKFASLVEKEITELFNKV